MLGGINSLFRQKTAAVARTTIGASSSSNALSPSSSSFRTAAAAAARALSTSTESLKVKSTTPPPAVNKEERIKYFKIYRWDPDHRQKPVRNSFLSFFENRNNISHTMMY